MVPDGSAKGNLPHWTAMAVQMSVDTLSLEEGTQQSHQWAKLQVALIILMHDFVLSHF